MLDNKNNGRLNLNKGQVDSNNSHRKADASEGIKFPVS